MKEYFIMAEDIAEALSVSEGTAYAIIRELNEELEKKGFRTKRGRTVRAYFLERYGVEGANNGKE